jgi:hypothetical protein
MNEGLTLLIAICEYLRNIIFQVRITLSICWTTKPFHNFNSKCINEIPLFIDDIYKGTNENIIQWKYIASCYRFSCYYRFWILCSANIHIFNYLISPLSIDHWCPLHLNNHDIVHVLWTQWGPYRFSDIAINSVNPSFIWRLEFSKNG